MNEALPVAVPGSRLVRLQPVGWTGLTLSGAIVTRIANVQGQPPATEDLGVAVRLTYPDGRSRNKRVHSAFRARPWREASP